MFVEIPDRSFAFGGVPGDIPIVGDWNRVGRSKIGVYRPVNSSFILDYVDMARVSTRAILYWPFTYQ